MKRETLETIRCTYNDACLKIERYINTKRYELQARYIGELDSTMFIVNAKKIADYDERTGILTVYDTIKPFVLTLGDIPGATACGRTLLVGKRPYYGYDGNDYEGAILARQDAWSMDY